MAAIDAVVVPVVVVDQAHPRDRAARVVQLAEDLGHARAPSAGAPPSRRCGPGRRGRGGSSEVAQVGQRHRATRAVAAVPHPRGEGGVDRRDGRRRTPGRRTCASPRSAPSPAQSRPAPPCGHGRPTGQRPSPAAASAGGDPRRRPVLLDHAVRVEGQREHARCRAGGVVPDEVAEAVGRRRCRPTSRPRRGRAVWLPTTTSAPASREAAGERPLALARAGLVLTAPVQVDHDEVLACGGSLDGGEQQVRRDSRGRPRSRRCPDRPAQTSLAPSRWTVSAARKATSRSSTRTRAGRRPRSASRPAPTTATRLFRRGGPEGVGQADLAVVAGVVVGDGDHVDARRRRARRGHAATYGSGSGWRRASSSLASRRPRAVIGVSRLSIATSAARSVREIGPSAPAAAAGAAA